jgi:hypothetical protein
MIWDMTCREYIDNEYLKLKDKYPHVPDKNILECLKNRHIDWHNALLARAEVGPIPDKVLDDFVKRYGEIHFNSVFRGRLAAGVKGYLFKDIRLYDKTYSHLLRHRTKYGLSGNIRESHRYWILKALECGRTIPQKILEDYNIAL